MNCKINQHRNYAYPMLRKIVYFSIILFIFSIFHSTEVYGQSTNQPITVKGKVLDEKKEPIIGATVLVVGTSTGTVTDIDGNFSLKASTNSLLSFSYIGYSNQKLKASTLAMTVVLKEDNAKLDEVVVVG